MGSADKIIRGGLQAAVNPIKGTKTSLEGHKDAWGDITGKTKQKAAAKDAAAIAAEQRALQMQQLAELDDEENRRIKKLISGARGTRNYKGGPMFRSRSGNSAGGSASSAAGAGSSSPNSAAFRSGGMAGGLRGRGLVN